MKRYQFIVELDGVALKGPVVADYGNSGPKPGKDALWAYSLDERGNVVGFDPWDFLRWTMRSEEIEGFDNLDEALNFLRAYVQARERQ